MALAIVSPQPNRPWQFRLADLLFLSVLNGALCSLILPVFYSVYHTADPGLPYPSVGVVTRLLPVSVILGGTAAVLISAGILLLVANRLRWPQASKWFVAGVIGMAAGTMAPAAPGKVVKFADSFGSFRHAVELPGWGGCMAYHTAQEIYHRADYNNDGVLEYAMTASGTYGLGDPNISLISRDLANAFYGEGHRPGCCTGYVYKMLKGEGPHARGGRRSYVTRDSSGREHMTGGFALVAAPAVYGTGYWANTIIVNQDRMFYVADFGDKTPEVFNAMTEFDPDPEVWHVE